MRVPSMTRVMLLALARFRSPALCTESRGLERPGHLHDPGGVADASSTGPAGVASQP